MRLISCSLTQRQIRDRSKTETRRLRWLNVKPGDVLCFVDKCMGLKKGERPQKISLVIVTHAWREPLNAIDQSAVIREGFPEMTPPEFVSMFSKNMRCAGDEIITPIRFLYIPGGRF